MAQAEKFYQKKVQELLAERQVEIERKVRETGIVGSGSPHRALVGNPQALRRAVVSEIDRKIAFKSRRLNEGRLLAHFYLHRN